MKIVARCTLCERWYKDSDFTKTYTMNERGELTIICKKCEGNYERDR